ncbi:hypothetical protein [Butyrivibrio sp. INlla16]|nr:hypothetical protein [Butyrivibrio sp. INlla16]SDB61837.1 hypothetical protein SAMN02910263_03309 [Butyrivibrio sp. INlla16]
MADFTWFKDSVPKQLPVKQVYGIAFSADNLFVLMIDDAVQLAQVRYFPV